MLVVAGLVLAAAVLPLSAARAAGGQFSLLAAALAGVSSFAAAPLLIALILVLAGGGGWWALWPAVLLVVHVAWIAPVLVADRQPPALPGSHLGLLSLNVQGGGADAARIVQAVRDRRVDVLVLVELTARAVTALESAGLDALLPYADLHPLPGAGGVGIWTRGPLTPMGTVPGTTWPSPIARVTLPGGDLTVVGVHLTAPQHDGGPSWQADATVLAAWLRTQPAVRAPHGPADSAVPGAARLVVAGDFNAGLEHAPFQRVVAAGVSDAVDIVGPAALPGLTWPADVRFTPPLLRLDHVLVSPATMVVRSMGTLRVPGTDHLAVVAALAYGC